MRSDWTTRRIDNQVLDLYAIHLAGIIISTCEWNFGGTSRPCIFVPHHTLPLSLRHLAILRLAACYPPLLLSSLYLLYY